MSQIKLFESKQIRSVWNEAEEKWYFSVQDVIEVLTDSTDPKQYIKKMRKRDPELAKGWVQFVPTLWQVLHPADAFFLRIVLGLCCQLKPTQHLLQQNTISVPFRSKPI